MKNSVSRRDFFHRTAAGIGFAWGGLQVSVGSEVPSLSSQVVRNSPPGEFIYGTHFYHPQSGPRPGQFRDMLKAIVQEYRFNIIRIYPPWDYYNPQPDQFVFGDIEEVLKYCDEFGLRVLMTIFLESAPYWLEQAHPETRYVNAKGQFQRLGGSGSSYTGGFPGLCMDWELVQQAAARFILELVKVVAPHPSVYAYDVWNEPQIVREIVQESWPGLDVTERLYCYCEKTIAIFQNWLRQRYGTLDQLNQAWIRKYPDWKTIDPPRRPVQMYTDWVDWREFIIEQTSKYIRFRVDSVRAADPRRIIETHTSHYPPVDSAAAAGTNCWRLADAVDVFGGSFYPLWGNWRVDQGAAKIEITRSCGKGKEFWMTELQGGHGNTGVQRSAPMRRSDIRLWNWLGVTAGAKGIIYWTYLAEGTGREASGFGLVARSGAPTERAEEAAKTNYLIQSCWDILRDYRPQPEVAILFDQDNALLTFAMSGDEKVSTDSFSGYYRALWNLDLCADFIEPADIGKSSYKVLIVPWHLIGKKGTCESLRHFAEEGGTLILETAFGMFDETHYYNAFRPPYGLDQAFGYREKESLMVEWSAEESAPFHTQLLRGATIEFSEPVSIGIKAHTYITPLEIGSARSIAKWQGVPVAAMKKLGQGQIYYLGTNLGASIEAGDLRGVELLRGIVTNVARPRVSSVGKLRPRLIEGPKRSLLTIFNESPEDSTASITIPVRYRQATEIYSHTQVSVESNAIRVTVPHEDVAVFFLE